MYVLIQKVYTCLIDKLFHSLHTALYKFHWNIKIIPSLCKASTKYTAGTNVLNQDLTHEHLHNCVMVCTQMEWIVYVCVHLMRLVSTAVQFSNLQFTLIS